MSPNFPENQVYYGPARSIMSGIFLVMMYTGPIIFGICGFLFTAYSITEFSIEGLKSAFDQKSYFDMLRYALPFLFIKTLTIFAGIIGLVLGWIPGFFGLMYLERNDPPPSLENIYIPKKRR